MNVSVNAAASAPLWGDFGGRCLVGACRATPELYLPGARIMGLEKAGSYLLGTWRTEDGEIHRFLRTLGNYDTLQGCSVFSTSGSDRLTRHVEREAAVYRGGIRQTLMGDEVSVSSPTGAFDHLIGPQSASWTEGDMLKATGSLVAMPTQWFNPWRNGGGGYAMTSKFRGKAEVFGQPADGFFALESHFFPAGLNFMQSPYGFGGREVHWGHMATAFEDGTIIDASLAWGPDGWGFALLTDEQGQLFATPDIEIAADVRPNGYPETIVYRFLEQEWIWRIEPKGERENIGVIGIIGAEGVLTRAGETRRVVAAQGTIDWWTDGRAAGLPPATP